MIFTESEREDFEILFTIKTADYPYSSFIINIDSTKVSANMGSQEAFLVDGAQLEQAEQFKEQNSCNSQCQQMNWPDCLRLQSTGMVALEKK